MVHQWRTLLPALLVAMWSAGGVIAQEPQTTFHRTATVDRSVNADFNCIQAAINEIVSKRQSVNEHWTVLIYAGTYTINSGNPTACQPILLDEGAENISLVGVDRDSVILDVISGSSQDPDHGIRIVYGDETERNNAIRNLTIRTTEGHGILIERGAGTTNPPKNIVIDNVTIDANGTGWEGISASEVDGLSVRNCSNTTEDGHGIEFVTPDGGTRPRQFQMLQSDTAADGANKSGIEGPECDGARIVESTIASNERYGINVGDNFEIISSAMTSDLTDGKSGIRALGMNDLVIFNSRIAGRQPAFDTVGNDLTPADVRIIGSQIESPRQGLFTESGIGPLLNWRILSCLFHSENINEAGQVMEFDRVQAIYLDRPQMEDDDIVFQDCGIVAFGHKPPTTQFVGVDGIQIDNVNNAKFVHCDIQAHSLVDDEAGAQAGVTGLICDFTNAIMIGGSIETSAAAENAVAVFDLDADPQQAGQIGISLAGTRFSKWTGEIHAAGRPRPVTLRILNVAPGDDSAILANEPLDDRGSIEVGQSGILDNPRAVILTWHNSGGANLDLTVVGTNSAGETIAEKFTATPTGGDVVIVGAKPFATVTKVFFNDTDGQFSVGTTNKLGLGYPLAAAGDVIQQSRKTSSENIYDVEGVGTVDQDHGTVEITNIAEGDSFDFAILTVQ